MAPVTRGAFIAGALAAAAACAAPDVALPQEWPAFDPALPLAQRVDDLLAAMTLAEKVSQMNNRAPAIARLNIPAYDWWSEALHGVARDGYATVFPQAIGMAATWNTELVARIGQAVSTEARAKYDATGVRSGHATYNGLTVWSPNVNIFRDPRWGRGQETYGEDPFLTSRIAVAYVRGLQGDDPRYIKVAATAKHFAVHSGPETLRHVFNVDVDDTTLHEFYLYAFRALVQEARVAAVMSAYNALNGTPCSANAELLRGILRDAWGFEGYVTSDCGAIWDMVEMRHVQPDLQHAAAAALTAGVDLCCGDDYSALVKSVAQGLVSESQIDGALRTLLRTRFRLGMFDPPSTVPYDRTSIWQNDSAAHADLALRAARESIVLLKNDGTLPLRKTLKRIAVIGPNGDSTEVLAGNYNGTPSAPVTVLQGIRAKLGSRTAVQYVRGCEYVVPGDDAAEQRAQALAFARTADVIVFAGGISPQLEGEEMTGEKIDGFDGGDRTKIELPAIQTALLRELYATGTPVVFVQMSGSAIACPWEAASLPAIVQAWYPGQAGGTAIADVLFGDYNPAGRLPVTFYAATSDLPDFKDYRLTERTYRYFTGKPLFAFGHGVSYTRFAYSQLAVSLRPDARAPEVRVTFTLRNAGKRDGEEVAQVYVRDLDAQRAHPIRQLCAFTRTQLRAGEKRRIVLDVPAERFAYWDAARSGFQVLPGAYEFGVGSASDDIRLRAAYGCDPWR